jgi:hypothetical protein
VSIRLLFCSAKTGDEGEMWGRDENIEEMMMMMKVICCYEGAVTMRTTSGRNERKNERRESNLILAFFDVY